MIDWAVSQREKNYIQVELFFGVRRIDECDAVAFSHNFFQYHLLLILVQYFTSAVNTSGGTYIYDDISMRPGTFYCSSRA